MQNLIRINLKEKLQCQKKCRGVSLSRQTRKVADKKNKRAQRTDEQIHHDNINARVSMAQLHQAETESEDTPVQRN